MEVIVYLLKVGGGWERPLERGQHRQGSKVKETLHGQEPKGGEMKEYGMEGRVCSGADPGALVFVFRAMGKCWQFKKGECVIRSGWWCPRGARIRVGGAGPEGDSEEKWTHLKDL